MDTTFDYLTIIGLLLLIQPFGYINSIKIGDKQQQINFNDNSILRDSNKNNNLNNLNLNNQNNYHNRYETVNEDNQFIKIANNNNDNNNNEMLNNNNYVNDSDDNSDKTLNLTDQVKLLTKQLNALMMRRREDYKLLENNLKKSLRKSTLNNIENVDMDIHNELEQMRHEIKDIRSGMGIGNKEKLTVEWLTQSIAEMRKELTELQEIANNASKDINRRSQNFEDMATVKNDFQQYRLELEALKERQQTSEIFIRELREEMLQKEDDFWQVLRKQQHHQQQQSQDSIDKSITKSNDYNNIEPEADHKMRHQRYIRQQIHDLDISQRQLKQQLNELQYHRIGDRVRNIEIEQRRLANANFNLSRQIAGLDKLHTSMLELLEDVNGIQSKFDKTIPDLKREISKLEFTSAQLTSEQNLIKEEGNNVAKSIQAMAVSVSALQDERDHFKDIPNSVKKLQENVERLESVMKSQKSIVHRRIEKMELEAQPKHHKSINNPITLNSNSNNINHNTEVANNLVQQLQTVELQYESIINKLPTDCSQVEMSNFNDISTNPINNVNNNNGGLFLIAPAGQHRPVMAYCNNDGWTTIQRRYDGSVDFNRSWESYGQGFGSPSGEFWIGNDMLHHLTSDNCTKLKIIMQDIYDNIWYANYNYFYISSKLDGYRLNINNYNGNASDALDYQNHMEFSAIDVDRDISNTHCAANYEGGWWFSHCQHANLNGRYNLGLTWFDASRNEWIAVKSSQMMITKNQQCYMDNNKNSDSSSSSSKVLVNSKSDHHNNNNNNNNNILIINDDTINESSSLSSLNTENPIKTAEIDDKTQLTIENSLIRTTTTITSVV